MQRFRFSRAFVAASVVFGGVVGGAAMGFAAAGDPIPGVDISLEQGIGGLVAHAPDSGPVTVKLTPALTPTPANVTVGLKGPKVMSVPILIPAISPTPVNVTKLSGKLVGQMDCQVGSLTTRGAWMPPSGKISLKYDAINPLNGKQYASTAYVRMTTGHDPARNDDVAFVGTVTAGVGAGQTFVWDQVLSTAAVFDWWDCSQGGPAVSALTVSGDNGFPPGPYNGGLQIGTTCGIVVDDPATGGGNSIVVDDPATGGGASCHP